jgi:hypothetical protein
MIAASRSTHSSATSVVRVVPSGFQLWSGLDRLRNACRAVQGHRSVSRWRQEQLLAQPPLTSGGRNLNTCVVQDGFCSRNQDAEIKQRLSTGQRCALGRAKKCRTFSHRESFTY